MSANISLDPGLDVLQSRKAPLFAYFPDVDVCGDGRKRYERDASEMYEGEIKLENNRLMIQCSRWTKIE